MNVKFSVVFCMILVFLFFLLYYKFGNMLVICDKKMLVCDIYNLKYYL